MLHPLLYCIHGPGMLSLQRIRVEYADPINHISFHIMVHSDSKQLEIVAMKSITPAATIQELYLFLQLMASTIHFFRISDTNGVKHIYSASYHPSSCGAAECFLKTLNEE